MNTWIKKQRFTFKGVASPSPHPALLSLTRTEGCESRTVTRFICKLRQISGYWCFRSCLKQYCCGAPLRCTAHWSLKHMASYTLCCLPAKVEEVKAKRGAIHHCCLSEEPMIPHIQMFTPAMTQVSTSAAAQWLTAVMRVNGRTQRLYKRARRAMSRHRRAAWWLLICSEEIETDTRKEGKESKNWERVWWRTWWND